MVLCRMRLNEDTTCCAKQSYYASDLLPPALCCSKYYFFCLTYEGTTSNGKTEISAPDNVFDGTTTPAYVYAISSSAQDGSSGTGALTIALIGIDENDEFINETITMNGTTQVQSANKYKRIFHAYVTSWGSGKDAVGDITITDDGQSTTYLTIAAGDNESNGAAIWIPEDYSVIIEDINSTFTTQANVGRAGIITVDFNNFDGDGLDPDLDKYVKKWSHYAEFYANCACLRTSDGDAKVTFSEQYILGSESFHTSVKMLIAKME